jgi:hypothetical protein
MAAHDTCAFLRYVLQFDVYRFLQHDVCVCLHVMPQPLSLSHRGLHARLSKIQTSPPILLCIACIVYLQYARLRGTMNKAQLAQERSAGEARPLWFTAAYELLALSVNGKPNPALAPAAIARKVSLVDGWKRAQRGCPRVQHEALGGRYTR